MEPVKVGADTQAWCTSCRSMQEHVVVAMVGKLPAKVECAHCHKQHLFRAGPPGAKVKTPANGTRPRKPVSEAVRNSPPKIDLVAMTAGREARYYDPVKNFAMGDVVRHPNFGIGVVVLLPGPQKMEVAFEAGQKLLAHDRGAPAGPGLARPAPRNDDDKRRVSDAPPDRPPRV